jgi:hypothetical protein
MDQRDKRRGSHDRRRRVHHDAQRTMIGIAQVLMSMNDLRHCQKGQKDHANDSDHREGV